MPRIYDFDDFVKHVYGKEGSIFTSVKGPNGSGKTEFNLYMMERIHALGIGARYGSNMPIPDALQPNFEMDFIEDLETLEATCRMLNPPPVKRMKKYIFFLSELGKFVPKDEAWNEANREFIKKMQTVRKFGLCLQSDFIDRVDERILSHYFFNGIFEKPFPENPRYATYKDLRTGRPFTFKEIPKCKMWFDTYYSANFYLRPQGDKQNIRLDENAQIVKDYLDNDCSWKKAGIETKKGKRAIVDIATRYIKEYSQYNQEPSKESSTSEHSTEIES